MSTMVSKTEEKNKRIGTAVSAVAHLALLMILFLSVLKYPDPPPGQLGVLVSFGEPDAGQGDNDPAPAAAPLDAPEEPEEVEPEEVVPPEPEKPVTKPKPTKTKPVDNKKVIEDKTSKERALARQKEKEKQALIDKANREKEIERQKENDRLEKIRKEQERKDRIAKEKADAERKEREAKQAAADALKAGIGDAFGKGKNNKPGNQGTPDGDPDGKALDGISTGTGVVGGGLSGRNVVSKPTISDRSQKTGDVNVKICVDRNGRVTSANNTLKGSSTNDPTLVKKAIAAAKKWRFNPSSQDKQCGTVLIKFRFGQ